MFSRIIAGTMKWGSWGANLSPAQVSTLIEECVAAEVTTFDHADIYGGYTTEELWGQAIGKTNLPRDRYQLITKCGIMYPCENRSKIEIKHYDVSKEHIVGSVERSLKNLATDYIDCLLIHRPSPLVNPEEIGEAIDQLISEGKILQFGVSNFTASQMELLADCNIVTNQLELSALHLDSFTDGTLDSCMKMGVVPTAWSPLGGGSLFGKTSKPEEIARNARLRSVAKKYDWALDEMLYLFLLHHPANIHPVTGTSKIERIKLAKKCEDLVISDSQWFEIWSAGTGQKVA